MGYVVVVFAIINAAALLGVGYFLRELWHDLPTYVGTAIQDEVRKQDDRIEKRVQKLAEGPRSDQEPQGSATRLARDGIRAGVPVRRHA